MTKSSKINAYIKQAQDLGLLVEIEDRSTETWDRYTIRIRRNFNGNANMLEMMFKNEELIVNAHRYAGDNKPRAFKLLATYVPVLIDFYNVPIKHITYRISNMAEDLTRYNNKTAA